MTPPSRKANERTPVQLPQTGARVQQAQYGHGTITSVNEYHTVIEFDEAGTKTFITTRVVLTASDVPAPVKVKKTVRRKKAVAPPPVAIEANADVDAEADVDADADADSDNGSDAELDTAAEEHTDN